MQLVFFYFKEYVKKVIKKISVCLNEGFQDCILFLFFIFCFQSVGLDFIFYHIMTYWPVWFLRMKLDNIFLVEKKRQAFMKRLIVDLQFTAVQRRGLIDIPVFK